MRDEQSQQQKMARGLKFRIKEVEGMYYLCSEITGADQFRGTAKLICVFVFAYAKSRFSHDAALIIYVHTKGEYSTETNINFKQIREP